MQINWPTPTASTTCSGSTTVTQTGGSPNGNQFTPGTYTITYQATDNCGNSETCSFTVTVSATSTSLSLNCPSDLNFQIPSGQSQAQVTWNTPTATTNCSGGTNVYRTSGPPSGSYLSEGTYTVTYQATDDCGNSETCSFNVIVNPSETTTLSINCPANSTLQLPSGQSEMTLDWEDPTATTTCSGQPTIKQIGGAPRYSHLGVGSYTISYEATDDCGNRETCSFIVKIELSNNSSSISLNCPSNIVVRNRRK